MIRKSKLWSMVELATRVWRRSLARPESVVSLLLVGSFVGCSFLSPFFLDLGFLLDSTSLYTDYGLVALAMTFVIIAGQIDLSVASEMVLAGCITALFWRAGFPMGAAIVVGLVLGAVMGLLNGLAVTKLQLPALAVTLGTMALYRGIAQVMLRDYSISRFPAWFSGIDRRLLLGVIPAPLLFFLAAAAGLGILLHRTVFGRWVYAVGTNEDAARYAGIPVDRIKVLCFVLSGLAAAAGGIVMTSRLAVARYNLAVGRELEVITAVVLGGTDIFGGRGSMFGTVVATFLVGLLRTGMGVANVKAEKQLAVIGILLILAVVLSNLWSRRQKP